MKNHLTIDFEEWYQGLTSTQSRRGQWTTYEGRIRPQTEWILQALSDNNVKATFFVIGQVARDHPDLIKLIARSGHEVGLHGDMHKAVFAMSQDEFRKDLACNYQALTDALPGSTPVGYRAAYASLSNETEWIWDELVQKGVQYDSSVFPIKTPLYGMPGAPRFPYKISTALGDISEFPISTIRFAGKNIPFSGGFYFRALPYHFIKAATLYMNRHSQRVIFYFHPWEFDPEHPQPACVTRREKLSHYGFLKGTKWKFIKLLQDFQFVPLQDALNSSPPRS